MIPKIIHYCWFGKGLMPHSQKKCIEGWKKLMPDYQIIKWDETNFDISYCPFTREAYKKGKYAYVADVARLKALTEHGGVYLDTDVELFGRFDSFLNYSFFSGIELYHEFDKERIQERFLNEDGTAKDPTKNVPRLEILTSTMGCEKDNPLIEEVLEYYKGIEATEDLTNDFRKYVNFDRLMARHLTKYGFRYKDETQHFGDRMVVFGTGTFGYAFSPNPNYTISYHHNAATWESERWTRTQRMSFFFDKIGLLPVYKGYKKLKKKIKGLLLGK